MTVLQSPRVRHSLPSRTPESEPKQAELARLVAHPTDPRPFRIDAENRYDGPATLGDAAAYVLTVADDVVAFDADHADQVQAVDRLADALAADGRPVLRVASGREGHQHLWTVEPDAVNRARLIERATEELGLPAPRSAMRPPGAAHRLGLPVALLDDPDAFQAAVAAARADTDRPISRADWRAMLRTGRFAESKTGGDLSGSALVWEACIAAIRDGVTLDQMRQMLADETNAGGRTYRKKGDRWLIKFVWPSAAERAAVLPPADDDEARAHLHRLAEAIEADQWVGMAGATDRAVMRALVARGIERGSLTPSMSHREIAEAAPCSRRTVGTSTARLSVAGWITVASHGRGRTEQAADGTLRETVRGTRWCLRLPVHLRDQSAQVCPTGGTPPLSTSLIGASERVVLDVCRWRGLGLNALRVLTTLVGGPMTAADLASVLGLNKGNLRSRLLPKLAAHGLVVQDGTVWVVVDDLDSALAVAAKTLGLEGKTEEVAAEHAAERAEYLEHRELTRPGRDRRRRVKIAATRRAKRDRGEPLWPEDSPRVAVKPNTPRLIVLPTTDDTQARRAS